MKHSDKLNLDYQYYPALDQLIFEDGVCYKMREAMIVSRTKHDSDLRAIHLVKKMFGGEVIHHSEAEKLTMEERSWFEVVPPVEGVDPTPVPVKKKAPVLDAEILTMEF